MTNDNPPAIQLSHISKNFGVVRANDDISLTIKSGDIHGIIGENGAGKSTLMSILYGLYHADEGDIHIFGRRVIINSAADALTLGIGMVHQHFMLVPPFNVLENIILGHEGGRSYEDAKKHARSMVKELEDKYGLSIDLDAIIADMPVGQQQQVEILKALYRGAKILILDEPTGVLTPQETDKLFEILKLLKAQGVTILLITHKLREIMAITDCVSVMRRGKMIEHLNTKDTDMETLASLLVGRDIDLTAKPVDSQKGEVILRVKNLSYKDENGVKRLKNINFDIYAGEILGLAGVSGNGQSELLSCLSGISPIDEGVIEIGRDGENEGGHKIARITPDTPLNPKDLKAHKVAHVPEDRHRMGVVLPFAASESNILGYEYKQDFSGQNRPSWWYCPNAVKSHASNLMNDFDVRPPNPDLLSSQFSGGNQQKLVLAREMDACPELLLVGQPTRGVDIGAIEFIHSELNRLKQKGCAILLVSVELEEIFALSDRVMVINNGEIMGIEARHTLTEDKVGRLMTGATV